MLRKWHERIIEGERWNMAVRKNPFMTTDPWSSHDSTPDAVPSWWRCYWASRIAGEGKRCDCGLSLNRILYIYIYSNQSKLGELDLNVSQGYTDHFTHCCIKFTVSRSWMQQEYQPHARLCFLDLPVSLSSWSLDLPLDGSCVFCGESLWDRSMIDGDWGDCR